MKGCFHGGLALALALGVAASPVLADDVSQADTHRQLREARERLEAAAREIADLSGTLNDDLDMRIRITDDIRQRRAMLGVNIDAVPNGVRVLGVTPGSPAEEAGLRAGDVLVAIDAERLDGDEPVRALMTYMQQVEPGDAVSVTYERDDRRAQTEVVATGFRQRAFAFAFDEPGRGEFRFEGGQLDELAERVRAAGMRMPALPHLAFGRDMWRGVELVELTPGLAAYFGVERGLLVVRVPQDTPLPLADGDVIVQIAGATPRSPADALRQLRFYEQGDTIHMEVVRQRRALSLEVTVPASENGEGWGYFFESGTSGGE